jgi:hypothetical protein
LNTHNGSDMLPTYVNGEDRDVSKGNETMQLRRITARRSSVHGKGLFALQPITAGERLDEYKGEVTSWLARCRTPAIGGRPYVRVRSV